MTKLATNPGVTRNEWLWAAGVGLLLMALTSLPYLYGLSLSTPARQFSGFIIGVEDGNSYLGKMRMGAAGSWRFNLAYTPEPHPGVYLYTFHLGLGKLSQALTLPPAWGYHLARLAGGMFLLLAAYRFVAEFVAPVPVRRLALWLVGLGSGLGWLVIATGWVERIGLPLDIYLPEAFAFIILFSLPHLLFAQGLLLWGILSLLRAWQRGSWGLALVSGLLFGLVLGIAAFYIAVIAAVLGATLAWRGWLARHIPWRAGLMAGLALLIASPVALYNAWVFSSIEAFQILGRQLVIRSPAPIHYLLAFGPLALLAVPGGLALWRSDRARSILPLAWCLVTPLLVYLPFNLQRRLTMGVQVPLSILAALGAYHLLKGGRRPRRWRLVAPLLVLFFSLTNLLLLAGSFGAVAGRAEPVFVPGDQARAARWLAEQAAGAVILAAYETGNYLPAYADVRAFVGHGPETIRSDEKRALAARFFAGETDDAWRRALLAEYNVGYLYYGPHERALGDFEPDAAPYLRRVYQVGEVVLYAVGL
ncbi:MAG: hypothetical protein ACE5H9_13465 [Anaerolineae bacterium]